MGRYQPTIEYKVRSRIAGYFGVGADAGPRMAPTFAEKDPNGPGRHA